MLRALHSVKSLCLALTLGILLAGCQDAFEPTPGSVDGAPPESDAAFALAAGRPDGFQTIDDRFTLATREIPGFGGLFYDPTGRLTVYLKQRETLSAVRPHVERLLVNLSSQNPSRLTKIAEDVSSVSVLPARYDFGELRNLYLAQIIPFITPLDGITMTDIDERETRIKVGVRDAGAKKRVQAALQKLRLPADAVNVVEFPSVRIPSAAFGSTAPPSTVDTRDPVASDGAAVSPGMMAAPTADLTDELRPVPGGMRIQVMFPGGGFDCTMAHNMVHRDLYTGYINPERYFLTNSHCTDVFGSVTFWSAGQPLWERGIGYEFLDPPLRTSAVDPACPPGRQCRSSDAALFRYTLPSDSDHPWMAYPYQLGSTTFDEYLKVRGMAFAVLGETVYKIGATTGRTAGEVLSTCMDIPQATVPDGYDTGRTMICQGWADFDMDIGDSGSPVVSVNPDGSLADVGIAWGAGPFSEVMSYWTELMDDHGTCCFESFGRSNPSQKNPTYQYEDPNSSSSGSEDCDR